MYFYAKSKEVVKKFKTKAAHELVQEKILDFQANFEGIHYNTKIITKNRKIKASAKGLSK